MAPEGVDERDELLEATDDEAASGSAESEPAPGFLPELLRKGLTLGFTGVFLTEEALRKAFGDSVPRDWVDFVVEQSERTRTELVERLSREFGRVVGALDPVEVARRLLEGRVIEVSAQIRLKGEEPKEEREEARKETRPVGAR